MNANPSLENIRTSKVKVKGTGAAAAADLPPPWYKSHIGETFEVRDDPRYRDGDVYCVAKGEFKGRYIIRADVELL